ncbi:hypothetical protein PG995_003460 [Apiospora arundinis]
MKRILALTLKYEAVDEFDSIRITRDQIHLPTLLACGVVGHRHRHRSSCMIKPDDPIELRSRDGSRVSFDYETVVLSEPALYRLLLDPAYTLSDLSGFGQMYDVDLQQQVVLGPIETRKDLAQFSFISSPETYCMQTSPENTLVIQDRNLLQDNL